MKKTLKFLAFVCVCTVCLCFCACKSDNKTPESLPYSGASTIGFQKQVIETFQYLGVELLDSPIKDNYKTAMEYLLNIPNDDYLKLVRERANIDAPGEYLGGWDGGHLAGETFGQWLSAMARAYRTTNDNRYKEKALDLMEGWAECIEKDGFFYFNPNKGSQFWNYTYDKMVLGLTDIYVYIGDERALKYLSVITDYYIDNAKDKRRLPTKDNFVGEFRTGVCDNEWYTLSENLYRAYLATGDEKYKEFAAVWHYEPFWEALRIQNESYWTQLHAYSHVNSAGSAALAYMVTGDEKYKDTITGFYEIFEKCEFLPNGAFGVGECLCGDSDALANSATGNNNSFEAPCCTWAGFKLSQYLMTVTGEAFYGDWTEKLLYNGIMSALPMKDSPGKRGETFYYADYTNVDGVKDYYSSGFPCCSGTYPLTYAAVPDQIYLKDAQSLYVNLYIPSRVVNLYNGKLVTLTQTTEYPSENQVNFSISCTDKIQFDFKIRIPSWINGDIEVTINGKREYITAKAGEWLSLGTKWKDKDIVTVNFPLKVYTEQIEDRTNSPSAFMYGPVMLVAEQATQNNIQLNQESISSDFLNGKQGDTYFIKDNFGKEYIFKPFYKVERGVTYNTFFYIN